MSKVFLSAAEAADKLGTSRPNISKMVAAGKLSEIRDSNGALKIRSSEVEALLKAK